VRILVTEKKQTEFEFERQMKIYKDLIKEGEVYEQSSRWDQALNIYLNAEKIVKKYGSKIEIGNIYYRIGKVYAQKGNLKESLNTFKESLNSSKKGGGNPLQIAIIKEATGEAYKINGKSVEAIEQYQEALKILNAEKERVIYTHSHMTSRILEAIAQQLNNIGESYLLLQDWDKALENCRESLKVALDTKTTSIILKSRFAIAKVYLEKGDNNSAIEYLLKSIDTAKTDQSENDLLKIYLEIANIYKFQNDLKSAFDYYKNSLKIAEKLGNQQIIVKIYDEMGVLYAKKSNMKKALELFQKSYELGTHLNEFYFEYILYHMALIQFKNRSFDESYEKLQDSLKIAEKTNNKQLLIKILIKIGDIWRIKKDFDDSIYYYKKALELNADTERRIIILYKIGKLYLEIADFNSANDYFLKSFKELRLLILSIDNFGRKKDLVLKFSRIIKNLCALKCTLYDQTKDLELLKEAIGFSESFKDDNIPSELKQYFDNIKCPERQKNLVKITETCLFLKNLRNQYNLENNFKVKERLLDQIEECGNGILTIDENIWELCNESYESSPNNKKRVFERFLQVTEKSSEPWVVLKFFYVETMNTLFIFLIDIQKKELHLFSKKLSRTLINSILLKLKQMENFDQNEQQVKFAEIFSSLQNLWDKLVPNNLTSYLFEQNYLYLTIIPHSFLWKLPWEIMQIKRKTLNELFKLSRNFSLDHLRSDIQRKNDERTFILIKDSDRGNCKILYNKNWNDNFSNEKPIIHDFLNYLTTEIKNNNNIPSAIQNYRREIMNKMDLSSPENLKISIFSYILVGYPFS